MAKTILTKRQQQLLQTFSLENYIQQSFYLSGGTALAEYYLQHRLSEDLDFFSFHEVDPKAIQIIFKKNKQKMKFQKVTYTNSFNRNMFFVHFSDEIVKTEFTYYPFEQIEEPKKIGKVKIDSLIDIAVNKTDTIFTNPRTRDFIDLYLILKRERWTFNDLVKHARIKFDTYFDPLHIVTQLMQVRRIKDYPHMLIPLQPEEWQDFWVSQAADLKPEALK